ncbi:DNA polymerase alpha catalytic subunit [Eupeodes corollae]|uniref:DNA polymerase alpha catalytic subunit n=1 Tax=Eupeodes corollae TaxID=290404 RepID=UPI0024938A56|nr:DNA polymerase alpha catalytic subunit [Eupeodes corollae]
MEEDAPRAKRQRVDKAGRFAALEKLKNLKGSKNKCNVEEDVDNVYEIIDEKDYEKRAKEKYGGHDWIEDDGTGYLEDGRDFFEDEDYSEDEGGAGGRDAKGSKKRPRDASKPTKGKGSIRNLFSNAVPKKKEPLIKVAEDDVLADILGELDDGGKQAGTTNGVTSKTQGHYQTTSKINQTDAALAKEYMNSFINNIKIKENPKKTNDSTSDDEMLDKILKPQMKPKPVVLADKEEIIKTDKINKVASKKNPFLKEKKKVEKEDEEEEKPIASTEIEDIPDDDMDFSMLNDDENQFEEKPATTAKPKDVEAKQEKSPKIQSKPITTAEDDMKSLLNNWENICNMDNFDEEIAAATSATDESALGSEELKFYYWEAWEDPVRIPGEVFLFGKLQGKTDTDSKSICVRVEDIKRVLYLLPREYMLDPITKEKTNQKVELTDVYKEFEEVISTEIGVDEFRSKRVTKNFAYHPIGVDVPEVCEYIEIHYSGKKGPPNTKTKYNSIAYIFGANTNSLERFILDRKIKGPCWLTLTNFTINKTPQSWCKTEVTCSSPNFVTLSENQKIPPPPICVLTLNVRTALNPKLMKNEIVMISCLVNNRFRVDKPPPNPPFNRHFCGFTRPVTQNWPFDLNIKLSQYKSTQAKKMDSERALLSWFLATYQSIDPDLIVTQDAADCQLDVICDRVSTLKIQLWSRLGRLRMSQSFGKRMLDFFVGRMVCDVKRSAEELIKSRSFDLNTLCVNVLKIKEGERMDVNEDELHQMFETGDGILKLITLTMQDCSFVLRLMCELNVMPLAMQITSICGNVMSRTLQGGRSERNEFLLLHAFTEKNYIVPDKKKREFTNWNSTQIDLADGDATKTAATRKKAAYSGGLVLEPVKGLYDKYILLMDFNSLYPSIIQEYNICFTTVPQPEKDEELATLPDSSVEHGILPRQIRRLVESRREVKKLMAASDLEPELKMQYHIRQMALKLTANSMYGCLGFAHSRFFAQHLAALVTHKGREILMNTKSLVQKLNYEVVYGDTDSIMINTNSLDYDQVFKIGHNIKQTVNKIYKQVELDIDGVFKCLLLLKKKKYAAVTVSKTPKGELKFSQEHKGLDIVRRDWSQIAVMVGKIVLDEILSDKQHDDKIDAIHNHLEKVKTNIEENSVPLPMFVITKQLAKAPKEFTGNSAVTQSHVQVALRMNDTKNRRYKKGDMVDYIICDDGTCNPATQRAYHLDEIKSSENLKVDKIYYLAHQIHPVIWRMCDPLEGTDASRIAQCLGLDPSKFKIAAQRSQQEKMDDGIGESIVKSSLQKFLQCEKFEFACVTCKTNNIVASAFKPAVNRSYDAVLAKCSNSECGACPYKYVVSIRNQLILAMRKHIKRFYENWLVCDDPACNSNTRRYSHVTHSRRPICLACKKGVLIRQFSERDLYNQLTYLQYMFDLSKHQQKNVNLTPEIETAYAMLRETVEQQLDRSAFCTISLAKLFDQLSSS